MADASKCQVLMSAPQSCDLSKALTSQTSGSQHETLGAGLRAPEHKAVLCRFGASLVPARCEARILKKQVETSQ